MGTVRGKLGDAVFYRRGGEQQQRAYIAKTNDANTRAQAAQRSQLANLIGFYRSVRTLLDHSFTNRLPKQTSYNAFVSANLGKTTVYMSKEQAKASSCVVAPYVVSEGALPPIVVTGNGVNGITNISVGALESLEAVTVAEFSAAVVAANPSIEWGDQLLYLSLVQSTNIQTGYPIVQAAYYEVTLSSSDTTLLADIMPKQARAVVNGFLAHGEKVADGGFCWILSRKNPDGTLMASKQTIIVTSTDLYRSYTGNVARTRAVDSYGAAPDKILVPGESTSGAVAAVPSVSSVSVAGSTLVNGVEEYAITAWGSSAALQVNGSNLGEAASVVVTVMVNKDGSDKSASIDATDIVVTDTKVTGMLAIPTTIQGGTLKSVTVAVDGTTLYTMKTKEHYVDPDNPLG